MRVRVFKKEDGAIIISCPSSKYQGGVFVDEKELTFDDCRFDAKTKGLEYVDMEEKDLPPRDSENGYYFEMLHFDGECKPENLKQDSEWQERLMPNFLVRKKLLMRKLTGQNTSKNFDEYIKHASEINELLLRNTEDELFWAEKALDGLQHAEKDKAKIQEKLKAKIESLKK